MQWILSVCMFANSLHAYCSDTTLLKLPMEEVVTLEKSLPAAELYNNVKKFLGREDRYVGIKHLSSDEELGDISTEYKIRGSGIVLKFVMDVAVKDGKYTYSIDQLRNVMLEDIIEERMIGYARRIKANDFHNTEKKAEAVNKEERDRDIERLNISRFELKNSWKILKPAWPKRR